MFASSRCSNVPSHGPCGREIRKELSATERQHEHSERQARSKRDRSTVDAANHAVEVCPPDIVRRRTVEWDGMAAKSSKLRNLKKSSFTSAPQFTLLLYLTPTGYRRSLANSPHDGQKSMVPL